MESPETQIIPVIDERYVEMLLAALLARSEPPFPTIEF
jgi:hypothetical protein